MGGITYKTAAGGHTACRLIPGAILHTVGPAAMVVRCLYAPYVHGHIMTHNHKFVSCILTKKTKQIH